MGVSAWGQRKKEEKKARKRKMVEGELDTRSNQ
jgi:hypothetical protein